MINKLHNLQVLPISLTFIIKQMKNDNENRKKKENGGVFHLSYPCMSQTRASLFSLTH